jgi:phosphoenolpyruvate carboxykinase (GTP)
MARKLFSAENKDLENWVNSVAELTNPDEIVLCDGSEDEWQRITQELVAKGTFVPLQKKPNSFWAKSNPNDVARVEDRTFICSLDKNDAGPTNNWTAPAEMKQTMQSLYKDCMVGRKMYVIPFCMGVLNAKDPMYGVEITDSAYVVASMKIMTRMGSEVLKSMGNISTYVKALHSVGAPLANGAKDSTWPCNETKFISHFPEEKLIWSYGSGYGGNALLGKKCYALRIASVLGKEQGWLAEHMLILKLTSPKKEVKFIAAAFPSACGKTNLAMLEPTIPGWKVETLGDDIAWLRFGKDGRLYAQNPEFGLFGVAPGTGWDTNPNAMRTIEKGNTIFTNVALTDDGDVWWEGMTKEAPKHLIDWHGNDWTPDSPNPSSHPNARFCTPIDQCPIVAPEWDSPEGVPISAFLFGGRRKTTIPLVVEARDWNHGVFLGATLSSETTAAATGQVGVVRRDPFAMLPFIGYHAGDYFNHWIEMAKQTDSLKLPKIYYVNWFRKDENGKFLWPGYGENSRVLKWIFERLSETSRFKETPIGATPALESLDLAGLNISGDDLEKLTGVVVQEWQEEVIKIEEWFNSIGEKLPATLWTELDNLKLKLKSAS